MSVLAGILLAGKRNEGENFKTLGKQCFGGFEQWGKIYGFEGMERTS